MSFFAFLMGDMMQLVYCVSNWASSKCLPWLVKTVLLVCVKPLSVFGMSDTLQ